MTNVQEIGMAELSRIEGGACNLGPVAVCKADGTCQVFPGVICTPDGPKQA